MMEALGKKVLYLRRISMGPLMLPDDLAKGECRPLTEQEIKALKNTRNGQDDSI
jgi:16S rRNA pseudouridine516 synthase